ncbi:hypothetical protein AA313_de0201233 [Arthrobotrys entomopaga]|nr:hypothetical protein AA313_de0201233 [Arthrobotrys entomopaga]
MPAAFAELVKEKRVELTPKEAEIFKAVLPLDAFEGVHQAFTLTGHIAHINLHDEYLAYKNLIAQVILDKNPTVRTVVNKTEEVGSTSEFRTFPMEIVVGDPETEVTVKHSGCSYSFDFAKVYWNSRLENEHDRIASLCSSGEAVCDVMAGVGPFAIPAARYRRALVWANDLNVESYKSMVNNVKANKVEGLVYPFNTDGRDFIRLASKALYREAGKTITFDPNPPGAPRDPNINSKLKPIETYTIPAVFNRFIMNLPATAVEFLDAFIGLYAGLESQFEDPSDPDMTSKKLKLPIIHVYTFHKTSSLSRSLKKLVDVLPYAAEGIFESTGCLSGGYSEKQIAKEGAQTSGGAS